MNCEILGHERDEERTRPRGVLDNWGLKVHSFNSSCLASSLRRYCCFFRCSIQTSPRECTCIGPGAPHGTLNEAERADAVEVEVTHAFVTRSADLSLSSTPGTRGTRGTCRGTWRSARTDLGDRSGHRSGDLTLRGVGVRRDRRDRREQISTSVSC